MNLFPGLTRFQHLFRFDYEYRDPRRLRSWRAGSDGIRILLQGVEKEFLPWSAVAEVVTFKRDLGDTDQVCLGFRRSGSGAYAVLEEDNPTWPEVLAATEAHFPLPEGWLAQVAEPPYACNWTTLWGEPPVQSEP
jgi:hypothetical protein